MAASDSTLAAEPDHPIPLTDYVAVGCLTFLVDEDSSPLSTPGTWTELPRAQRSWQNQAKQSVQLLVNSLWVRCYWIRLSDAPEIWRVHLLPIDVKRSTVPRESKLLKNIADAILDTLDPSPSVWAGNTDAHAPTLFDKWATAEGDSLFYMFNTLPSPQPDPSLIRDAYARSSALRLCRQSTPLRGLHTQLYPYQRRTAAMMLEREVQPKAQLDPRIEIRHGPNGSAYYYGPRDKIFLKEPRHYDGLAGGILAETMGLGKTLICIALVLSTQGHMPRVPPQYERLKTPTRPDGPASLLSMAAAALHRHQVPWRGLLRDIKESRAEDHVVCATELERTTPTYSIPPVIVRTSRFSSHFGRSEQIILSSATIVVVPRNLVHQWSSELEKHTTRDALSVLVLDTPKSLLPPPTELASYDVVLFSRPRFEAENKNTDDLYESPLKHIHFLRIILDEGHSFASASTHAALAAEKLVRADRRWVVSGTPAKDLLGVEVELGSMNDDTASSHQGYRHASLLRRKSYDASEEQRSGAVKALGMLASRFLGAQPWATSSAHRLQTLEHAASWDDYIYRHESDRGRTFTSFSTCLRRTLESLVIKTQPDDVEKDLVLPPLRHKIVLLQPSLFDKITANLFVLLFTANAITSERKDQDYLFHRNSIGHLHRLITNLHRSSFSWTGFREQDVMKSIHVAESYLSREGTQCTPQDRQLMKDTIQVARKALDVGGWIHLSQTQEMGIFVQAWPEASQTSWAFPGCLKPMLIGLTQAVAAQKHLNNQLAKEDPLAGFDTVGVEARAAARAAVADDGDDEADDAGADNDGQTSPYPMVKAGVPSSSVSQNHMGMKRLSVSGAALTTPKNHRKPDHAGASVGARGEELPSPAEKARQGRKRRRLSTGDPHVELAAETSLGRASVIGTTSSKMSYLLGRVLELYREEKILVFFDADYIAYYLSQAFDLFGVKHLIYANSLSGEQRSKYIVLFDTDGSQRVLLMDIKQAAHGLNLSSASRVFFVNPAYRPDVEAQAIKRAHRIGQCRPVHVETLVLSGTVEEAVHQRANNMTRSEHAAAKTLEEDAGIRGIIQSARAIPVAEEEMYGWDQVARLRRNEQLFGRPGRGGGHQSGLEKELFGEDMGKSVNDEAGSVKKPAQRKAGSTRGQKKGHTSARTQTVNPAALSSIFG